MSIGNLGKDTSWKFGKCSNNHVNLEFEKRFSNIVNLEFGKDSAIMSIGKRF
jgi:hypothetical protein